MKKDTRPVHRTRHSRDLFIEILVKHIHIGTEWSIGAKTNFSNG